MHLTLALILPFDTLALFSKTLSFSLIWLAFIQAARVYRGLRFLEQPSMLVANELWNFKRTPIVVLPSPSPSVGTLAVPLIALLPVRGST